MRITAIEPQKKNPRRVNVYLDGGFAFGLTRIVAAWLKVGQELSEEKIAALQSEDERENVYQKALHFLSYRPRSSAEIRQNLTKRGLSEPLVEETIQHLRNAFHPRGKSALKMELRRKGLDEEVIGSVLNEQVDEETLAFDAARKYARRLAGLEWPGFRQKLGGFLARRGFSYSTIAPVISEVWKEISQTADGDETLDDEE
jgi:regulatory protein